MKHLRQSAEQKGGDGCNLLLSGKGQCLALLLWASFRYEEVFLLSCLTLFEEYFRQPTLVLPLRLADPPTRSWRRPRQRRYKVFEKYFVEKTNSFVSSWSPDKQRILKPVCLISGYQHLVTYVLHISGRAIKPPQVFINSVLANKQGAGREGGRAGLHGSTRAARG